ncbi:isocitrate lyase/phosphoenolpyruvate mutase family protein [Pendulispora albinea]|uniref:Isocitrate lyase/phosphoenolpyruvate mutase family protein n=1 Tax=Pendulispora albinea TaxID=2741071 RepID=A0ABZ2LSD9_9BACT
MSDRIHPSIEEKAAQFSRLHDAGCFVLPNAWDVPSALLAREAGFAAVATTSAGVALARGFADGERISRGEMLAFASELAQRLPVPVTADLEAGYGPSPEDVATSVRGAIRGGIVGCNIEDTDPLTGKLFDLDLAAARIRAGVEAAHSAKLPDFVLNARIDTFLTRFGTREQSVAESIRRAHAYLKAGARSVFVPGPTDAETIRALVAGIDGPLNVWGGVGDRMVPLEELRALGVRRVSLGPGPMLAAYTVAKRLFAEAASGQSFAFEGAMSMFMELSGLVRQYPFKT